MHTYKVCRVLPRELQHVGRPRREILLSWEGLSAEDLEVLRRLQEPRLKHDQIAELDGKIVARGEHREDDAEDDDHEEVVDHDAAHIDASNPIHVTTHATRMLWDVYERHAAASSELRQATQKLNERALEQAKQIDAVFNNLHRSANTAPISISLDDIGNFLRVGAGVFRDVLGNVNPEK